MKYQTDYRKIYHEITKNTCLNEDTAKDRIKEMVTILQKYGIIDGARIERSV